MIELAHNSPMLTPTQPETPLRSMAIRAAINQVACVMIAVALWAFGVDDTFWAGLVFSLLIGNACWLLIDGTRALVSRWLHQRHGSRVDWPGWRWMVPIVIIGALLGYTGGHAAARALLGMPAGKAVLHTPVLIFSVIAAMIISYFFYARERVHAQQLEAEAAQRLASEVQLKLLQSQLEPHMLFNTLANLRVLIGLDAVQAQSMLDHLIAFLRTTLASTRTDSHALASEFDALGDYLALMAVRMGPRLRPQFDLPDDLRALPIPPLLLQPLVENAIKHGLEPQVDGGRLEISAARQDGLLRLRVRDTGAGLAPSAGGTAGSHFGLDLVRQRLARFYGERASLTVQPASDAEGGTEALILLPVLPLPNA